MKKSNKWKNKESPQKEMPDKKPKNTATKNRDGVKAFPV